MTLEAMLKLRMTELKVFFGTRYGRGWRQIVARQLGSHPRAFERWTYRTPLSLYRALCRVEAYARSLGFASLADGALAQAYGERQDEPSAAQGEASTVAAERTESAAPQ